MKKESTTIILATFLSLTIIAGIGISYIHTEAKKPGHTLTNEQIMVIYRQGYLNGYNARDLTYEQFKLRMTADSLKMADLMK